MTSLLEGAKKLVTRSSDIGARVTGLDSRPPSSAPADASTTPRRRGRPGRRARRRDGCGSPPTTRSSPSPGPPARASPPRSTRSPGSTSPRSACGARPPPGRAPACGARTAPRSCSSGWASRSATRPCATRCSGSVASDDALDGVVLLDLPDHDSTEVSHHLEVDRLVELADLLVWVLDPQKYADAAVHDRYLAADGGTTSEVVLVVLNHIDTVPPEDREPMLDDIRRLLAEDGLERGAGAGRLGDGTRTASTRCGARSPAGWPRRRQLRQRVEADVVAAAERLDAATGRADDQPAARGSGWPRSTTPWPTPPACPRWCPRSEQSTRIRANRATGWPLVAWVSRLQARPAQAAPPRPRAGRASS